MEIIWINDDVAFSEQPSHHDLKRLREMGIRTLVNVRLEGEQFLEDESAGRLGLRYESISSPSVDDLGEGQLEELGRTLRRKDVGRVLVHSARGARAGALVLAWVAAERGWSLEELDHQARRLGLDLSPDTRRWVARRFQGAEQRV